MNRKNYVFSVIIMLIVMLTTACGSSNQKVSEDNFYKGTSDSDMITVDIVNEPASLNNMLMQDGIAGEVLRHCLSGLIKLDANDVPIADLAESWEVSKDNRLYTFYLRKDAKWTNGEPVTASDYYYSWTTQMNKGTGSLFAFILYDNIKNGKQFYEGKLGVEDVGVKVIDEYTLEVEFEQPIPYALYLLSLPTYQPVNQKTYEEIGAQNYAKSPEKMITNGPYIFKEWVHDDYILLEKNPDYYGEANVNIPKVKLVMISDQNTRINAFKTGMLDICNISGTQIEQIEETSQDLVKKYVDNSTWFFRFNYKDTIFANENMRKAFGYSVDMQTYIDYVIKDGSIVANGLVPTSIVGANNETYEKARGSLFAYDLDKAKEHFEKGLEELGMSKTDIKIEILCSDSSYDKTQAEYVQEQWKKNLGVSISINPMPWKARIEKEEQGDFQVSIIGWGPDYNDAMTFLTLFDSENPNNTGSYKSEEYDKLLKSAVAESDFVKRQEFMIQAEKILIEDMAIAPMYFTCTVYSHSRKVENFARTGFQALDLCDGARIVQK